METTTTKIPEAAKDEGAPRRASRAVPLAALAFFAGALLGGAGVWRTMRGHMHAHEDGKAPAVAKKAALYRCPMHPAVTSDHPGNCPICGMKLIQVGEIKLDKPAAQAHEVEGMAEVTIDPGRQQLIGLRTAKVSRGSIGDSWHTPARIEVSPARVRKTNVKVEGFVERMFVDFVGQSVRKGQPLFSIYSPALLAAQNEYLLALQTKDALAKGGALPKDGDGPGRGRSAAAGVVGRARQRDRAADRPAASRARP